MYYIRVSGTFSFHVLMVCMSKEFDFWFQSQQTTCHANSNDTWWSLGAIRCSQVGFLSCSASKKDRCYDSSIEQLTLRLDNHTLNLIFGFFFPLLQHPPHCEGRQCAHGSSSWQISSCFRHANLFMLALCWCLKVFLTAYVFFFMSITWFVQVNNPN